MIRLWWLIWYFTRSDRFRDGNVPNWVSNDIIRSHFVQYLSHDKRFLEDWLATIVRWCRVSVSSEKLHLQNKRIKDLIDKALARGYLFVSKVTSPHPTSLETYLSTDYRGRDFVHNPLVFFNAVFKEYGYVTSFIFGSGGTLLFVFWNKIIEYIINLL